MSVPIVARGGVLVTNGSNLPLDTFDRVRVSSPTPVLSNMNCRPSGELIMDRTPAAVTGTSVTAGSGTTVLTSTYNAGLKVSTVRQSYRYTSYVPGISKSMYFTGVLQPTTPPAASVQGKVYNRLGLWDGHNGMFWEFDAGRAAADAIAVCIMREDVVVTRVTQSDFNINTLTAITVSNPSGGGNVTPAPAVDFTNSQVFTIDQAWLGVGSVRFGVFVQGQLIFAHVVTNFNALTEPYTPIPNAPIRYECTIDDTGPGTVSGATSLTLVEGCAAVFVESGTVVFGSLGAQLTYLLPSVTYTFTGERPILCMRASKSAGAGAYYDGVRASVQVSNVYAGVSSSDIILLRCYRVFVHGGVEYGTLALSGGAAFANPYPTLPEVSSRPSCLVEVASTNASGTNITLTNTPHTAQLLWANPVSNNVALPMFKSLDIVLGASVSGAPVAGASTDPVPDIVVLTAETLTAGNFTASIGLSWTQET